MFIKLSQRKGKILKIRLNEMFCKLMLTLNLLLFDLRVWRSCLLLWFDHKIVKYVLILESQFNFQNLFFMVRLFLFLPLQSICPFELMQPNFFPSFYIDLIFFIASALAFNFSLIICKFWLRAMRKSISA